MLRRSLIALIVSACWFVSVAPACRAIDDPRLAPDFVEALRDRGYFDLALDYLDQLRKSPDTPDDLRKLIDYEEGRTLIRAGATSDNSDTAKERFDQARVKIEAFVKANPDLPETTEAIVALAQLLYQQGKAEVYRSGDARGASDRESSLAAARGYYSSAREAYVKAFERLNSKLSTFAVSLQQSDPKWVAREKLRGTVMEAEIQKSIVDYEEAQTYPVDSKERNALLDRGLIAFDDLYKRYRGMRGGLDARMWQGKCFEEKGGTENLGKAMGIYKELIEHSDPSIRFLQKQVDYFRIIVMGKRKQHALAADECVIWLRAFPRDRRSYEALGVQFELGKNLLAQLPNLDGNDHDRVLKLATDTLADVVRVVSPFKPEAVTLLQKYRPKTTLLASDVAKLTYDEAMGQGEQAVSILEYDKAIALYKVAIRKADPARDAVKANKARYMLMFSLYMTKRYYESAVVAEYLARRYPLGEFSPKASEIGCQAYIDAYNTYTTGARESDLDRLLSLARYAAQTWPETEAGDIARQTLGQVLMGRGEYVDAIAAFDSVRTASSKWVEAQAGSGGAHYRQSQALRDKGDEKGAEAEVAQAVDKLKAGLKGRKDANVPETDPGYVNNACDLAYIDLDVGKPAEAFALLDPIAKKLESNKSANTTSLSSRVMAGILRVHVSSGKVEEAIKDMQTIEALGGGTNTAQLYYELGKLLEREIETLKRRNDKAGLQRTEQAYQKFLKAYVASKTGQTYGSLCWAADNLLKLGMYKEANDVYTTVLNTYTKEPAFLKAPGAADTIVRLRVKQVTALREGGNLADAEKNLNEVVDSNKKLLETQLEKGYLLEAKAEVKKGKWTEAYAHWKGLAGKLANTTPKPPAYYESWYHAAYALKKEGKSEQARETLAVVLRLSSKGISPEMKAKYQELSKQITK